MRVLRPAGLLLCAVIAASFEKSLQQTNPATITINSTPYEVIATPITPNAPYSQAALQCNVSGDSRIPGYSTFPLTVVVPKGQMVRVIFANGNLGGATVTQQGEPGVIVQQSGGVVVQQAGSASPIVQTPSSPVVQQAAPPAALVSQQSTTSIVQQPNYQTAPTVEQPQSPPPPSPSPPTDSSPPPPKDDKPCGQVNTPVVNVNLPCNNNGPNVKVNLPDVSVNLPGINLPNIGGALGINLGRKLLQDTVPGGPNNGLVEYVALASANSVPGFVVPNTQFGVPYLEFSASDSNGGQTAVFKGVLEVAQVNGGKPQYPFTPNPRLSPECQVNVNFQVA